MPLPLIDTRRWFRPLAAELVSCLREFPPEIWSRRAVGDWQVRDVLAHLLDTALRRLSFHRDGYRLDTPRPDDFVSYINELNATWIRGARRLSPRVLTDLYGAASSALADFVERLPLDSPALFPVSWADEDQEAAWLDIAREFTEIWHHGMQIREAAGVGAFSNPQWLRAVIEIALRAVPRAYADRSAPAGRCLAIHIDGPGGGDWALQRDAGRWRIGAGAPVACSGRVTMSDDAAWRLFFNALSFEAARDCVHLEGDETLGLPLLRTRAVIV